MSVPATSGSGESDLSRLTSAAAMTLTPSHDWLFELSGSGVTAATRAQSLMSCGSVAVCVTTTVVLPPAGSVPRLQVTTPEVTGHAPPGLAFAPVIVNVPLLT